MIHNNNIIVTHCGHYIIVCKTKSQHEGIRYNCNQCNCRATQRDSLKTHIDSKHKEIKYNAISVISKQVLQVRLNVTELRHMTEKIEL